MKPIHRIQHNPSPGLRPNRSSPFLSFGARLWQCVLFLLLAGLPLALLDGAQLKEARVSQIIKDVKLLPPQAAPRPAAVSDEVRDGTAVRTGIESRAELTFTDQTLARLGANTIFTFNEGTRNLDLNGGAMLLRVPKNAGGAQIHTAAVTAAITGTTVMLEYNPDAYIKFIVLEGVGRMFRTDKIGESVLVHAGQMLIVNPNGKGLPDPVDVDLAKLMQTSLLITGFPPLRSLTLIDRAIDAQMAQKTEGDLIDTNLVIFGAGTAVSLLDPTYSSAIDQANNNAARKSTPTPTITPTATPTPTITPIPTITPTPTPGKYGTLPVITSPDPYVITNDTVINTDPTITTDGQTDLGKIYRGPDDDGAPSAYLFGATSTFDTEVGFDQYFGDSANLPLAAFKFSALQLAGNPTIELSPGGPTNLALISVGDITSGTAQATLTFTGIDSLLLATQDGSIMLGSNLTFQNIPALFIYARGAGSTLTFDAAVNGTSILGLVAEGNIEATNSLIVNESGAGLSEGLILSLLAGQAINIGQDLTLSIAPGDNAPTFALINLSTGTDIDVSGAMALTIDSSGGGHIGGDIGLDVFSGGDLTASALNLLINNRDGGAVDGAGALTLDVDGAITIGGDVSIAISNRDDGGGAGTMGGPATLNLNAGSISIGGLLDTGITPPLEGGTISSVTMSYDVAGDFIVGGSADIELANGGGGPYGFHGGGIISGDALLSLNAGSLSVGDFFSVFLINVGGGEIGGDAIMSISTTNDLTATGQTIFQLANGGGRTVTSGTTDGSALLTLNAGSISIGDFFGVEINNESGSIGKNAILTVGAGDITATGDALFDLLNGLSFEVGGTIGGDATISIAAQSLSATNLTVQINNLGGTIGGNAAISLDLATLQADSLVAQIASSGGFIGGDATITFNIAAALTTTGDAIADIDLTQIGSDRPDENRGNAPATIAGINFNGGTYNIGGTLHSTITGVDGGITINAATMHADILKIGALGNNGTLTIGGGSLSGDTTLKLYAGGSNGSIDFVANVSLSSLNDAAIIAANTVTIENGVVVTTSGFDGVAASVFTNVPNYTGSGGNGNTTGVFAGDGATTASLDQAPPFDDPLEAPAKSATAPAPNPVPIPTANSSSSSDRGGGSDAVLPRRGRPVPIVRVRDSNELLALADRGVASSSEAGRDSTHAQSRKNSRGPGSVLSGKGPALPTARKAVPTNVTLSRNSGQRALWQP